VSRRANQRRRRLKSEVPNPVQKDVPDSNAVPACTQQTKPVKLREVPLSAVSLLISAVYGHKLQGVASQCLGSHAILMGKKDLRKP
jgi:hypothetical protein